MAVRADGSSEWNLYRPSRRVVTRPASSSTSRCWETACLLELSPCRLISRAHSSNSVWSSRSWSSSRMARRVGSARALNTSPTTGTIGKYPLACLVGSGQLDVVQTLQLYPAIGDLPGFRRLRRADGHRHQVDGDQLVQH